MGHAVWPDSSEQPLVLTTHGTTSSVRSKRKNWIRSRGEGQALKLGLPRAALPTRVCHATCRRRDRSS